MNLIALTPTGCRPDGLALLAEYVAAQTYDGPLTWVVVDDCDPASRIPKISNNVTLKVVRPSWRWRPGENTQAACLLAGLEFVPDDAIVLMMEDDDIYLPGYVSDSLRALDEVELVGERDSRYYNVATGRWRVLKGRFHASFASTVLRGSAIAALRALCSSRRGTMLDVTLWKTFAGTKRLMDTANVVGIKGLPGRPGIGVGHRRTFGIPDNGEKLREWAGAYADNYDIFRSAA